MAKRLKKTTTDARPRANAYSIAPELVREAHKRETEWNGLKMGDPVKILRDGRRAQWKFNYTFLAHVTAPDGSIYIDVLERPRGDVHGGKWRSFEPKNVVPA